ncbi:NAD(P)H-dependent oxidoreductase [Yersinia enterocolitica]|uniref:NAD(P)H-dependent oxidoreductase n=1 Tax=Pectobacterium versatile TaxID=2488639 RepID=UPI001CF513B3|nr:NAD(P)H-dependent oxidoreductase [Pectobacterium versatile]EKN6378139.1 flavodoxin family protein [Yersinia enterocolitica]MCA6938427.1 NAD(P)H-dependent oxidoreductase [Pectobacterium versatile]
MKNVLIINAHQYYEGISSGELNNTMITVIQEEMESRGCLVRVTNIEKGYEVNEEVERHLWADIIITQSPVYWFGTPWIYKKYIDEVFTAGLIQQCFLVDDGRSRQDPSRQYGTGGKMQGKQYMLSLTWNAPKEAFDDNSQVLFSGKSVDDVFIYNTVNYKFCGVVPVPSFSCFNVMKAPEISKDIERLKGHLVSVFF